MKLMKEKYQKSLFLVAIFLSTIILTGDYIITPTVNALYGMFPTQTTLVNFIVSGSYLVIIFASVIAGKLCNMYDKKVLLIIGGVTGVLSGGLLILVENALYMAVMRGFFGVAYALTKVAAISIISDVFTDDHIRGEVIGFYNAFTNLMSALMSSLSGYLATISLRAAYSPFWLIGIYLLLLILFVPRSKTVQEPKKERACAKSSDRLSAVYWLTVAGAAFFCLSGSVCSFYVSVYIAETDLGTSATAGYVTTVVTIAGFIAGLTFGKVFQKLSQRIAILTYLLGAVSILLLYIFPNRIWLFFSYSLMGIAIAWSMSFTLTVLPSLVPDSRVGDATAYNIACSGAAAFSTSFIVSILQKIMHTDRLLPLFPTLIAIALISVLLQYTALRIQKKNGEVI